MGRFERLLALLSLLQDRAVVAGPWAAAALGVDVRTIRRDVAELQALGYAVETVRGRHGGYRLAAGARLPPLQLDEHEAAVVVLGVDALRRDRVLVGETQGLVQRLTAMLPIPVAQRVAALRQSLADTGADTPAPGEHVPLSRLLDLGAAVDAGSSVLLRYVDRTGTASQRRFDPWGLVRHRSRWYLVGHDHRRDDLRVLRVDRVGGLLPGGTASTRAPEDADLAALVRSRLTGDIWEHEVVVEVDAPLDVARRRTPAGICDVTEEDGRTVLRMGADDLDGAARFLASLDLELAVRRPAALRSALHALGERLTAAAGRGARADQPGGDAGQPVPALPVPPAGQLVPCDSRG